MYKAYASCFVSYLINSLKEIENIQEIIIFGSVAKKEANKDSDIDIFIELNKKNKTLEKKINNLLEEFYRSREALIFKTKNIDNKINIIIGKLEDWPDLKESVESDGIVLYGHYKTLKIDGKKHLIIYWDEIKENRGAFLNKIYGFNSKNKKYPGILENFRGKKIGKSAIIIPIENKNKILELIKHHKVSAKILEIYM